MVLATQNTENGFDFLRVAGVKKPNVFSAFFVLTKNAFLRKIVSN
ncbi:hypothetical protein Pan241w_34980 [Gimesia alba]|uniref:Uncharacterized protein n=1 Tax=Gimesia alba TaxID=2527973 RepID=A0A517RHP1_9PLAN|nr:hypothetical protein Pan241w_34980 [Gimesia alba]